MSQTRARLGFIGAGYMGQLAHLANYAELPECQVVAIAEIRPRLAEAVAQKYGIGRVYANHGQLLRDPDVQAVVCIQPWHNNYPLARQVLEAGRSLLTEKPMVTRLDDGQELVEIARRQGLLYAVGFMKRYDLGVQLARGQIAELVQSSSLGALRMVDATCYMGDWLENVGRPIMVDEPTRAPEVVRRYPDHVLPGQYAAYDYFINVFAHNINLIRYLLPDEHMTFVNGLIRGRVVALNFDSRDVVISLRGTPSAGHAWSEETRFVFDRGYLVVRTPTPMNRQAVAKVILYREAGSLYEAQQFFPAVDWAFRRQAQGFTAALLGQTHLAAPAEDCLRDVALMEDVFRTATIE